MKNLLVLLMLFWYCVPALPLQTNATAIASQNTLYQVADTETTTAIALLFQGSNTAAPAAILQLDETPVLPIIQTLAKQAFIPFSAKATILVSHFSERSDNGLHTILTAGP